VIKTNSAFQKNIIIPIKSTPKSFIHIIKDNPSNLKPKTTLRRWQLITMFLHLPQTENGRLDKSLYLTNEPKNITAEYLQKLWDFISRHPFEHHRHRYGVRKHKSAAVMSCGKTSPSGSRLAVCQPTDGTSPMRQTISSAFD